jgi:hypothetical protein
MRFARPTHGVMRIAGDRLLEGQQRAFQLTKFDESVGARAPGQRTLRV